MKRFIFAVVLVAFGISRLKAGAPSDPNTGDWPMSSGERVAIADWKIACIARQPDGSMRSTEIPASILERLEPYAHRPSDIGHRTSDSA